MDGYNNLEKKTYRYRIYKIFKKCCCGCCLYCLPQINISSKIFIFIGIFILSFMIISGLLSYMFINDLSDSRFNTVSLIFSSVLTILGFLVNNIRKK